MGGINQGQIGIFGGDGGSSTATEPHNLLDGGTAHLDTTTQAVSRGSLIYGNSTPKWDELVVGAANSVLWSDGTDVSWSVTPVIATSVTVPTIYGSAAANGDLTIEGTSHATKTTSVVFIQSGGGHLVTGTASPGDTDVTNYFGGEPVDGDVTAKIQSNSNQSSGLQIRSISGSSALKLSPGDNNWTIQVANAASSPIKFQGPGSASFWMTANGNFILGSTDLDPGTGTQCLIFPDGTAPASLDTNSAGLYANDVSGTVNMFAINEAGESTRLSFPAPQTYTESNVTTDRAFDANSTTLDEIADVLGTLIGDLRARGIVA